MKVVLKVNRSEELRKVTTGLLKLSCKKTYYGDANDEAKYPYQTFILDSSNANSYPRNDDIIIVDIWDKSKSWTEAERLADLVEDNMNMRNIPNENILSTYILFDRRQVKDPDKDIKHIQIKLSVQNYYIGE
jgi:hypothetical protein